jgi:hypothetical protein
MHKIVFAVALVIAATIPASADPISDNITAALRAYQAGDMRTAKQRLDMASQQIAQRNAQLLATVFPRPYRGWTASKPDVTAVGNLMGGVIAVNCTYSSPDGKRVKLSIMGDSPMLAAFLSLLQNPQILMMSGNKVITVGGQQAIVEPNGNVQMAYGNRWFITAEGNAPASHKQGYVQAINFRALQQLR